MKLKNSTDWHDHFLRRMVSWCCKELGLPVRFVKQCQFRNRSRAAFSGHAYLLSRRIVVSIGPDERFPLHDKPLKRSSVERTFADRLEALVNITAHELRHLLPELTGEKSRGAGKRRGSSERATEHDAQLVLESFRRDRTALVATWSALPTRNAKPKATRQERNDAKARASLAKWERKLKLAKTKVTAYRKKVRYYDRVAATTAKGE